MYMIFAWLIEASNGTEKLDKVSLGKRLKAHRVVAGLSLRELAENVTVSAQALSQYETGQTRPRHEVLLALADALDTRVEMLDREPDSAMLGMVRILSSRFDNTRDLDSVKGTVLTVVEKHLALEHALGCKFPSPSLPVLKQVSTVKTSEDADELAQYVRLHWGLGTGSLSSVVSLFESRGIRVLEVAPTGSKSKDGLFQVQSAYVSFSDASRLNFPVVLVQGYAPAVERRRSLCRELANLILPDAMRFVLTEAQRLRLADWFAGSLLVPTSLLRELIGRRRKAISWFELAEVSNLLGAAPRLVLERCRLAGIISRDSHLRLRDGLPLNEKFIGADESRLDQYESLESSTRLQRFALRAVTEGALSAKDSAELFGTKEKQLLDWLKPSSTLESAEFSS